MSEHSIALVVLEERAPAVTARIFDAGCTGALSEPLSLSFAPSPPEGGRVELQSNKDQREAGQRSAFAAELSAAQPGDMLVLRGVAGLEGPTAETPGIAASTVLRRIPAAEVAAMMNRLETLVGPFGPDVDNPPSSRLLEDDVLETGRRHISVHPVGLAELMHDAAAEAAKREPDDGIVWISSDGKGHLLAHRGSYLFHETSNTGYDAKELGIEELPSEKGLYYFRGESWVQKGDGWETDWSWGLDVSECVEATPQHLEMLGISAEECAERAQEIETEIETVIQPAPAPTA